MYLFFHLCPHFSLVTDSLCFENCRSSQKVQGHLGFCPYSGSACCSLSEDLQLKKQFLGMNISDPACASAVKSILCARCDPFAAKLFNAEAELRPVPFLCNSTAESADSSFCSTVWDTCEDVLILNSPFAPALETKAGNTVNSSQSKLKDLWQSKSDFCNAFGENPEDKNSTCFNGEHVSLNTTNTLPAPNGLCLEKIGNMSYVSMTPHPDGSNRAFFATLAGKVFLATIPEQDSGGELELNLFLDLSEQVYLDTTFGMTGIAFHPNFAENGRFFAAFNCDRNKSPTCRGMCACNSDVGCDPSTLTSSGGGEPCRYHTVIAEYTANGTAANPSMAVKASSQEVRRIFTMGLPFTANHGGQILIGPADGYLYFMMGDGGGKGDPYNFAQNKGSLLGKIMRLDIDNIPSEDELLKLGYWGNYSVPKDNPYSNVKGTRPEIWAYGFNNPWRCSFDSEKPSYFLCGDVGMDRYEEVDLITKGGNYGWRAFEGPLFYQTNSGTRRNTSLTAVDPIFPVLGYNHSYNKIGSAAIIGGYVYRSQTDPCTYGSYVYGDLYSNHVWAASESPGDSGNFTGTDIPFTCAPDSPIPCNMVGNSSLPALKYVFSFGEDNRRDVHFLTQSGVYRVVRPSRCNYTCSKEVIMSNASIPLVPPSQAKAHSPAKLHLSVILLLLLACLG